MRQRKQSHFQQELAVTFSALGKKKKINRASAQPAQGPALKPRSPGRTVSLCFPDCGQLAGQGASGERPLRKKILPRAKVCGLGAPQRWALAWLGQEFPKDPHASSDPESSLAFPTGLRPGRWAAFSPWCCKRQAIPRQPGCFLSRFCTLHG